MSTTEPHSIIIISSDTQLNDLLIRAIDKKDYSIKVFLKRATLMDEINLLKPELIILGDKLIDTDSLDLASELLTHFPAVQIILLVGIDNQNILKKAIKVGISDYIEMPLKAEEITRSVSANLGKYKEQKDWVLLEAKKATANLRKRVHELEIITQLGKSITGSLNIDDVLTSIVDAAVELTEAEEGNILLLDEKTNEVYMRAARNFNEDFIRTFRLPINDSLVGTVINTGEPIILDEETPTKIKTSYLIHSLIYAPIKTNGNTIGVLGVDNRHKTTSFTNRDIVLLGALAEYAMIAIVNARLYENLLEERNKFETVLTKIQDCVILIDENNRLLFANQAALSAFALSGFSITGKPVEEVFSSQELINVINDSSQNESGRTEIRTEDEKYYRVSKTMIPEIGYAITMNDITYLKNINQIKSDFVNTVSHDLRSPLTAIMGYVELIRKTGPVNETQEEFINQIQSSVGNITRLVNDLLNLGRIESGFDSNKETFSINDTIKLVVDANDVKIKKKNLKINLELPANVPTIQANQRQIHQLVDNLIENMIKYTPNGKNISIRGELKNNQIILQFKDEGIGIPPKDIPNIFDKFYRASNIDNDINGTGLGLSIVKSIVDYHGGRIWVDSELDTGTSFFVVLPLNN